MRTRNLHRCQQQLKAKFLSEVPEEKRHLYEDTVSIFLATTIHAYFFEGYSGKNLVDYLMKKIPTLNGYEHSVYPHESLEDVIRKYSSRVEKKFHKFLK